MEKVLIGLVCLFALVLTQGCGGKNSTIVAELTPAGQLNPFVPGIKGGCIVEAGDNIDLEVVYENGSCTVKTTKPQTFSPATQ